MSNAPAELTTDDGEGGGDLPKAININISPQYPLPDKDPEMGGGPGITKDGEEDVPAWRKPFSRAWINWKAAARTTANPATMTTKRKRKRRPPTPAISRR